MLAITPFNFTAIAGNLSTAPALMGNTVVWKPAPTQQLSAHYTMQLLEAAGLPPGVVNMVTGGGQAVSEVALPDPALAGIHFTGSTATFGQLWDSVAGNLRAYRAYPRLVGETGGKDFVVAHPSADIDVLRVALVRGAFEYQGQKCSAASRAYVPRSLWTRMREDLVSEVDSLPMGDVTDFHNFLGAVIDDRSFAKLSAVIDRVRGEDGVEIAAGGVADDSVGFFVRPTVVLADDPDHEVFTTEYFGPILGVFVYDDADYDTVLRESAAVGPYAAHRLDHRPGPGRHRRGDGRAAVRSRQLLHQRQADRGGGRPTAVRWCPRQRNQRQGRVHPEPAALGFPPHDQGDLRAGDRLPLPLHGLIRDACPALMPPTRRLSPGLHAYTSVWRLRADAWTSLADVTKRLADALTPTDLRAGLQARITELVLLLDPLETYWAYPGRGQWRRIGALCDTGDYEIGDGTH